MGRYDRKSEFADVLSSFHYTMTLRCLNVSLPSFLPPPSSRRYPPLPHPPALSSYFMGPDLQYQEPPRVVSCINSRYRSEWASFFAPVHVHHSAVYVIWQQRVEATWCRLCQEPCVEASSIYAAKMSVGLASES